MTIRREPFEEPHRTAASSAIPAAETLLYCLREGHAWVPPVVCGCFKAAYGLALRPAACMASDRVQCPCRGNCWDSDEWRALDGVGPLPACPCGCPRWTPATPGVRCATCGTTVDGEQP